MTGWRQRVALGVILLAYLALGVRYAIDTPPWQAPDEPAHYNYIAQIVDDGRLPVLEVGDYPYERLEALKSAGFPDSRSVDGIEYEDYQPPGYYVAAAAPVALVGSELRDRLLAARFFGVFLGAVTVALCWAVARRAVPDDAALALAAASFVAFLPMHLAMNASANNDPLAYALMGGLLYVSVARATRRLTSRQFAAVGVLLFAGALLTKVSIYPAAVLLVASELAAMHVQSAAAGSRQHNRHGLPSGLWHAFGRGCAVCIGGLVLAAPWFVRNARLYGWQDPLGISQHNELVVVQPHTAQWIADNGVQAWLVRDVTFTHDSFWGVFGWLAVFLDPRIYQVLALVSVLVTIGVVIFAVRTARACRRARSNVCVTLPLLALTVLMTVFVYVAYNATFVQHQGRYLFTALIPLALFFHLGVREIVRASTGWFLPPTMQRPFERLAMLCVALAMVGLAAISLTRYVVPGLS